jgi:hypothetical protein
MAITISMRCGAVTMRAAKRSVWRSSRGAFRPDGTSSVLLRAEARVDEASLPTGHDAVDQALREHFVRS